MSALARRTDDDCYNCAANDADFNGGPWTRTKYTYVGVGAGVGTPVSVIGTLEAGPMEMNDPSSITGPGLAVSAGAAAGPGVAGQVSGTGPMGDGAAGGSAGVAGGLGAGIMGLATYTTYQGTTDLGGLPADVAAMLHKAINCNKKR